MGFLRQRPRYVREERKVLPVVPKTSMSAPIAPVVEAIRKPKETCGRSVTKLYNVRWVTPEIELMF